MKKKNPIKIDGQNHHTKDKREGQKKVKWCVGLQVPNKGRTKEGRDLVLLIVRSYLTHSPLMLSACKSWDPIEIGDLEHVARYG